MRQAAASTGGQRAPGHLRRGADALQDAVAQVAVDEALVDYMLAIVERTRAHESLAMGVSPRGAQALYRATQALAAVEGRDYATPDDVKRLVVPVFAHRVVVNTRVAMAQRSAEVAEKILARNPDAGGRSRCNPAKIQMKTAIVGLPMVGKTSLFTILTGVHEAARVGSLEARVGMTKVPDARLDALAKIFEPPEDHVRHRRISRFPGDLERGSARPELSGEPARGGCPGARAARVRKRHRAARKRLGRSACAISKTWRWS